MTSIRTNNKEARWEFPQMAIYRARPCPRCQYYVGYCLAQASRCLREVGVKSFCLNCNYQFAVRALVHGGKASPRRQRTALRARPETPRDFRPELPDVGRRPNYARELRAIGQELEKRRFSRFNLKCSDNSYVVWSTEQSAKSASEHGTNSTSRRSARGDFGRLDDEPAKMPLGRTARLLFNSGDVNRLEREGVQSRQAKISVSNGRRLSHLLRTIGEEVYRRNQRLLGIAWQEPQISVVAENVRGRREMNVLRTDNIFDLWVRMYLQRFR